MVPHSPLRQPLRDATSDLSVPNLTRLVTRLRDAGTRGSVTIVHAGQGGEGELALSIAAARLTRRGLKVAGPEPMTVMDIVEYGARTGAKVVFAGELRRADDGKALRAAAKIGLKAVGIVTGAFADAQTMVKALGPWTEVDMEFFSIASASTRPLL